MTRRLEGRPVLITGGASGIGYGTARRLADEGAPVALADVDLDAAEAAADALRSDGARAIAVACDVSDEASVESATNRTVDEFGGLYGVVPNAGILTFDWTHNLSRADWDKVIAVNLTGVFLTVKHALRPMLAAGRGSVVVTSSIAASVTGPNGSAISYAAAKGGITALVKQLATDYGALGIRANAIQPAGVAASSMTNEISGHAAEGDDRPPRPEPWAPIARMGDPYKDYGAAVAYLLSDDASFVTGTSLPVDGGYLAV